jgi:hypothetical protein
MAPKRRLSAAEKARQEMEAEFQQRLDEMGVLLAKEQADKKDAMNQLETEKSEKERLALKDQERLAYETALEKSRKAWECTICLQTVLPFRQPVSLEGGHVFCKCCLETVLASVAPATSAPCPLCKRLFSEADIKLLKDKNALSYRTLLGLYITCPLKCAWNGDAGDLETHIQSCTKAKCPSGGCGAVVMLPETVSASARRTR